MIRRRPKALYGVGGDPDPRFTLANERTLLAWIRTALAFAAGGLAILITEELLGEWSAIATIAAFTMALLIVIGALARWYRTERALRIGNGIPPPWLAFAVISILVMALVVGLATAIP